MKEKYGYVYILTNRNNNVLYIGVTSNLKYRIYQHKNKEIEGFTKKYNLNKLVYFETLGSIRKAIEVEKRYKKWRRQWKINMINDFNPKWVDLYESVDPEMNSG